MDPVKGVMRELLVWNDRIVPITEEKENIMKSFCYDQHLFTYRRLLAAIQKRYSGISESDCKRFLKSQPASHARNVRFTNKLPLRPIEAPRPNQRHMIDLVDLEKVPTGTENGEFRYVLAVLDVFTR